MKTFMLLASLLILHQAIAQGSDQLIPDLNGYIMFCPCMGKKLQKDPNTGWIFSGYLLIPVFFRAYQTISDRINGLFLRCLTGYCKGVTFSFTVFRDAEMRSSFLFKIYFTTEDNIIIIA